MTRFENQWLNPGISTLERLAGAFCITLAELLDPKVTATELALLSLLRCPDGKLVRELVEDLPRLDKSDRLNILFLAMSMNHIALLRVASK